MTGIQPANHHRAPAAGGRRRSAAQSIIRAAQAAAAHPQWGARRIAYEIRQQGRGRAVSWRDLKQVIDLRPVYHRKEERIRAHVILCWLALLLARVAENACGGTWPSLRRELDRIYVGTFAGPAGTFRQRTEITRAQRDILRALKIDIRPGSTSSHLPQSPDQHELRRLDTRPPIRPGHVSARQPTDSPTRSLHQLRNPGPGTAASPRCDWNTGPPGASSLFSPGPAAS